jgi:uncharacterized membrane protein
MSSSSNKAAITVLGAGEEIERRWGLASHEYDSDTTVTFKDAPGGRGTEIHVTLDEDAQPGKLAEAAQKLTGKDPIANIKDGLRRFKAAVETGEVPRSDGSPEGEAAERKLKQRPAQPLDEQELEKAGV